MPFGDDEYKRKVVAMNESQLEAEKKMLNTRLAGYSTKAAVSTGFAVVCPLLLLGAAYSGARIADAACKLEIVEDRMREKKCYKPSRVRDFALGAGITCATAGLAHGASTLAHHAIADMHYHHPTPQQEKWICTGVEDGVDAGSQALIYRGVRSGDYDPDKPARKICNECYCVSSPYSFSISHADVVAATEHEFELVSLHRLRGFRLLHSVLDSRS